MADATMNGPLKALAQLGAVIAALWAGAIGLGVAVRLFLWIAGV